MGSRGCLPLLGSPPCVDGREEVATQEDAKKEVIESQAEYEAAVEKMEAHRDEIRVKRDNAIRKALEAGVSKRELTEILGVTPQWLNRLLKGEAWQ